VLRVFQDSSIHDAHIVSSGLGIGDTAIYYTTGNCSGTPYTTVGFDAYPQGVLKDTAGQYFKFTSDPVNTFAKNEVRWPVVV